MSIRPRVVIVDGVPMSSLVAEAPQPRAVVLALHGGGTTAAYFDCPGHPSLSLLRWPGYGSSAPYPQALAEPEQRVRLAYGTVDRILGERSRGAGLFLMAHSNGCELALRMAADNNDLLGIEMAGTGRHYHPAAREVLKTASATHRPPGLRELLWHPTHLYPAELGPTINSASGAPYEAAMVTDWPRHDLFSAAPRFCISEQHGAGHNLSLDHTAAAYHLKVLSFAEECVVAREHAAEVDLEAG